MTFTQRALLAVGLVAFGGLCGVVAARFVEPEYLVRATLWVQEARGTGDARHPHEIMRAAGIVERVARREGLPSDIGDRITVGLPSGGGSRFVQLSYSDVKGDRAARVLNEIAQGYVSHVNATRQGRATILDKAIEPLRPTHKSRPRLVMFGISLGMLVAFPFMLITTVLSRRRNAGIVNLRAVDASLLETRQAVNQSRADTSSRNTANDFFAVAGLSDNPTRAPK